MFIRRADGSKREYWVLRDTFWDKKLKRTRIKYRAYIGAHPVITLNKAKKLASKLDIKVDELKKVNGLKILTD